MYLKLPGWLWKCLIGANVFNFVIGFIIADRRLMFLALISGIACYLSYKYFRNGDNDG